tara:strand:+ start:253 stop:1287 length:1035 start_codon:yes stop_codon:yes gene_type:complete
MSKKMFRRLQDALVQLSDSTMIIAEDISKSGQKVFRVDTIENLKAEYAKIQSPHWYECLLEDRPSRIFLDIDSCIPVDMDSLCIQLRAGILHKFNVEPDIEILDSCSSQKYSWHIIVTNVWLKNVYHVGAFIRRLVLATGERAIDTAIYTKNRMFRVCGSSKFSSTRVLKGLCEWHAVLVQGRQATFFECLEIDDSEPMSCSVSPFDLFYNTEGRWTRASTCNRYRESSATTCPMLRGIVQHIDNITNGSVYWHKTSMTLNGHYMVSTKSKQCAIAGRCHKGNNIWFIIKPLERRVFQRCYDDQCRSKAHEISVDSALWSAWDNEWAALARTPKNENTLYNMID